MKKYSTSSKKAQQWIKEVSKDNLFYAQFMMNWDILNNLRAFNLQSK